MRGSGCLRPLLISLGVVLLFLGMLVIRHRDVVHTMWRNATAMGRGAAWVERLKTPDDLFLAIESGALRGSILVLDGNGSEMLMLHADSTRPVFGVTRLDVLHETTLSVQCGRIDLEEVIPVSQLEELCLPLSGEEGACTMGLQTDSLTVEQIVRRMMVERDQAAQDWLILHLSADSDRTQRCPGARRQLPAPVLVLMLGALEGGALGTNQWEGQIARFQRDAHWRRDRRHAMGSGGTRLGIREQEALASEFLHRGTARRYAEMMLHRVQSPETVVWPDAQGFRDGEIASVGGAFPGVISLAAGWAPPDGRPHRSAVLLLEGLPTAAFTHLIRTGMDRALLLDVLSNPRRSSGTAE